MLFLLPQNENQMGKAGAPPPTGEKEGENQSLQPAPKHPSPSDTTPSSSAGSDGVKDSATEPPPASPNTTAGMHHSMDCYAKVQERSYWP